MQKSLPPRNPPWGIFDALIVLFLINILGFLFKMFGQSWLKLLAGLLPGGATRLNQLLFSSFLQTFMFLFFMGIFVFGKYKINLRYLGLVKTKFAYWLKVGLINGVILFFSVIIMGAIISRFLPIEIEPQPIAEIIVTAQTKWEMVIPFIVASIFAPISEELYFRGFLYPAFRQKIGVGWGIMVTSLIFGSLHFDFVRLIPLAFGGIWLNWLYERSGSIYTSIVAHSVWNTIMTFLIFWLPQVVN
ncbi:MAG: CPBP family intramembrane glutamic endopeptidase [Peptococcales bacterium]|jgi:membrane protease YdiL (CAAX protease family)